MYFTSQRIVRSHTSRERANTDPVNGTASGHGLRLHLPSLYLLQDPVRGESCLEGGGVLTQQHRFGPSAELLHQC